MKQSEIFAESEGDAWYERNKDKPRLPDPVIEAMKAARLEPKTVLEIGCGNGWRLAEVRKIWQPEYCFGCDVSQKAIDNAVFPAIQRLDAFEGLVSHRPGFWDIIIFGFCLYLIDRKDLMLIAATADNALKDGGHIIIHDFFPDYPYRRPYEHKEGIWSYHMDYCNLWLCNPSYRDWTPSPMHLKDEVGVAVLKKDIAGAYE